MIIPPGSDCRLLFLSRTAPNGNGSGSAAPSEDPRPGSLNIALVIGIVSTLFSLAFLCIIYARQCRRRSSPSQQHDEQQQQQLGMDPSVLPIFPFSSLKGQKAGLECAVCLTAYQEISILKLLPKCNHAFHAECVDKWLVASSTCPLCRTSVSPQDILLIEHLPCTDSDRSHEAVPVVQLQEQPTSPSSEIVVVKSASSSAIAAPGDIILSPLKRLSHKIILLDLVCQQRWSDLVPADVLFNKASGISEPSNHANVRMSYSTPSDSTTKARLSTSCIPKGPSCSPFSDQVAIPSEWQQRNLSKNSGKKPTLNVSRALSMDHYTSSSSVLNLTSHMHEDKTVRWLSVARQTLKWIVRRDKLGHPPRHPNCEES